MKIAKLSNNLINQIAAGEIIERPSSIVKELIENSIDSGARNINLHLQDGGISGIILEDDGCGIENDSLTNAVENHSTSKIESFSDLQNCLTHGFRGEALASISSVSDLKINSRTKGDPFAKCLIRKDGTWITTSSSRKLGTTVTIKELFYSIPARKKFLKSTATELSHCKNTFIKTSLIYENINFNFFHQNKLLISIHKDTLANRFAKVLGLKNNQVKCFENEVVNIKAKLIITTSNNSKNSRNREFFFVNNRNVKNQTLSHAALLSFKNLAHEYNRPCFLLTIKIPNDQIDFNVHPSKTEVRFKNASIIHELVHSLLKKALSNEDITNLSNQVLISNVNILNNIETKAEEKNLNFYFSEKNIKAEIEQTFKEDQTKNNSLFLNKRNNIHSLGFALGQLKGIYIIAENKGGMIIVDTHAAHERILFEDLKYKIENNSFKAQLLLEPEIFEGSEADVEKIIKFNPELKNIGFEIIQITETSFAIKSTPTLIKNYPIPKLIQDVLKDLELIGKAASYEEKKCSILGNIACKSAIKANQKLSIVEMNGLLRRMESTNNAGICNHGRPTWAQFSLKEFDKLFFRGH